MVTPNTSAKRAEKKMKKMIDLFTKRYVKGE